MKMKSFNNNTILVPLIFILTSLLFAIVLFFLDYINLSHLYLDSSKSTAYDNAVFFVFVCLLLSFVEVKEKMKYAFLGGFLYLIVISFVEMFFFGGGFYFLMATPYLIFLVYLPSILIGSIAGIFLDKIKMFSKFKPSYSKRNFIILTILLAILLNVIYIIKLN